MGNLSVLGCFDWVYLQVCTPFFLEPPLKPIVNLFDQSRDTRIRRVHIGNIYWTFWSQLRGIRGPVRYLAMVIIFDASTLAISPTESGNFLSRIHPSGRKASAIPKVWAASIFASFAVRLVYPVDKIFSPLNLRPAFLPQYGLAYTWGHASALSSDRFVFAPFSPLAESLMDLAWSLCLNIAGLVALFGVSLCSLILLSASIERVMGGFNLPALLYAIWNEVSFAMITPAVMRFFTHHVNHPIRLSVPGASLGFSSKVSLARSSYAAFLSHTIVSVGVELVVDALSACSSTQSPTGIEVSAGPVVITILIGMTNVVLSCLVGWFLVQYVPGAGMVVWQSFDFY